MKKLLIGIGMILIGLTLPWGELLLYNYVVSIGLPSEPSGMLALFSSIVIFIGGLFGGILLITEEL